LFQINPYRGILVTRELPRFEHKLPIVLAISLSSQSDNSASLVKVKNVTDGWAEHAGMWIRLQFAAGRYPLGGLGLAPPIVGECDAWKNCYR
jgi:hypothetical protein